MSSGTKDSEWNQNVSESLRSLQEQQSTQAQTNSEATPPSAEQPIPANVPTRNWWLAVPAVAGLGLLVFAVYPYLSAGDRRIEADQAVAVTDQSTTDRIAALEGSLQTLNERIQVLTESVDALVQRTPNTSTNGDAAPITLAPAESGTAEPLVPIAAPPSTSSAELDLAAVTQRLNQFVSVWSAGDAAAYIDFYEPNYVPDLPERHAQWADSRRQLVRPTNRIEVEVSEIDVAAQPDGSVRTRFQQAFSSATYSDVVTKTLVWRQVNGQWHIARETAEELPVQAE